MGVTVHNPYSNESLPWQKGNLHTHTTNTDGDRDPQAVVDSYASKGYGFLMISDHDHFTDPATLDSRGMALIPGSEVSANGPHILHVDARRVVEPDADRERVLETIAAEGGMAIMCHPNWLEHFNHCPQEQLEAWNSYEGIEICNGVCCIYPGSGFATDRWDRLLAEGRRVWGFANDDVHRSEHEGMAWNMVQCETREPGAIIEALRAGRFYASTGVTIDRIQVDGNRISVAAPDAHAILTYGDYQRRLALEDGDRIEFDVDEDAAYTYVRFECWGAGLRVAWTQPFFVERA